MPRIPRAIADLIATFRAWRYWQNSGSDGALVNYEDTRPAAVIDRDQSYVFVALIRDLASWHTTGLRILKLTTVAVNCP